MAENLFDDCPERISIAKNYSNLKELSLLKEEAFGEKDFFKSSEEAMDLYLGMLSELGKFAAADLKPAAELIDREGVKLENGKVILPEKLLSNLKKAAELGIFTGPISRKYDGFNLPRGVLNMGLDIFAEACPNTSLTIACFSMACFLEKWGTEEQKQKYLPKLLSNEWQTAMALTESGAGSDLGKLRTTAKREGEKYILNGTKQFITNGDADLVFTLARTDPKSKGLAGLSVLIVPAIIEGKDERNVKVAKIEDKICLHGSPTCELVFENSEGYLLGPEGQGFKVMLFLMNEARLAMAALANGICSGAIAEAEKYARTRVTMDKPIIEHPMVADMIYEAKIELRAMRSLVAEASAAYDWMTIYEKKGDEKNAKKWKKRYRRLTPLCKYMCAEKAITITRNMLQIFGGYGVCREYPAERFFRESTIYPIYEGTSQIQSLMVLKDTLKDVAVQATGFLGSLAGAWAEAKVTRDPMRSKLLQARNELNQAIRSILMSIIKDKFKSDIESLREHKIQAFLKEFSFTLLTEKTDLTHPFLVAERLTRIVCDYYALKCMVDRHDGDKENEKWILEFAELAVPRMQLENHYIIHRLPSTLEYMEKTAGKHA